MTTARIRKFWRARRFEKALAEVERLLKKHADDPRLWNIRGDLIQLLDSTDGPPLAEAGKSYRKALELNPNDLEAMEGLAHFYDAVELNRSKARKFAGMYLEKAKQRVAEIVAEMERIVAGR